MTMTHQQEFEEKRGLLTSQLSDTSPWEEGEATPASYLQASTDPTRRKRFCTPKRLVIVSLATLALFGGLLVGLQKSGTFDSQTESDAAQQLVKWTNNVKAWMGSGSFSNTTTTTTSSSTLVPSSDTSEPVPSSYRAAPSAETTAAENTNDATDEVYSVSPALEEEAEREDENNGQAQAHGVSQVFRDFAPDNLVDTLPAYPDEILAPAPGDPSERYLAYLPHSGFHNQRGEFTNAATLAILLNRTLVTPHARLGKPIPWTNKPNLEKKQASMQKSKIEKMCRPYLPELENGTTTFAGPGPCRFYHKTTEMTWPLMSNLSTTPEGIQLLPRDDMDPSWFTTPVEEGGLGLDKDDIYSVEDEDRYSWRIYEHSNMSSLEDRFTGRLNLDELKQPPYADKRLLYFGSVYGGARLVFSTSESEHIYQTMVTSLTFRNPLLDSIAIDIGHRLGGRENYVGLHLRVGDGAFKVNAGLNMRNTWNATCVEVFGLPEPKCKALGDQNGDFQPTVPPAARMSRFHRRRSSEPHSAPESTSDSSIFAETDDLQLDDLASSYDRPRLAKRGTRAVPQAGYLNETDLPLADSLQCQRPLYTEPELTPFNRPVYIATDSHYPREAPNLQVFFKTFPCAFVLSDFIEADPYNSESLPDLAGLFELRSQLDGVKMAQFLLAFLEAEVASRSLIATYGTQGSTFSMFARKTLHGVYAEDPDEYRR